MALGLKVLAVLFVAIFLAILIVIMPSNMLSARSFSCVFNVGECMTNDGIGLTTSKVILSMSYDGTLQANERGGFV